jgi:hypothetical protein
VVVEGILGKDGEEEAPSVSVVCGTKVEDDRHKDLDVLDGDNLLMKDGHGLCKGEGKGHLIGSTACCLLDRPTRLYVSAMLVVGWVNGERGKRKGNIGMSQLARTPQRRGCGGWGRV